MTQLRKLLNSVLNVLAGVSLRNGSSRMLAGIYKIRP